MYDLKKVDEKFHEFLREVLNEERFPFDELEITEKLLEQEEAFYIPFGTVSYFLVIEDQKPVVYLRAISRMDLYEIVFIDENGYESYDLWDGGHREVSERYHSHLRNVRRFDEMKFMPGRDK